MTSHNCPALAGRSKEMLCRSRAWRNRQVQPALSRYTVDPIFNLQLVNLVRVLSPRDPRLTQRASRSLCTLGLLRDQARHEGQGQVKEGAVDLVFVSVLAICSHSLNCGCHREWLLNARLDNAGPWFNFDQPGFGTVREFTLQ